MQDSMAQRHRARGTLCGAAQTSQPSERGHGLDLTGTTKSDDGGKEVERVAAGTTSMEHVRYIDRTRDYYLSQGYEKSYDWAHFDDVPFTPLQKPLSECRVGLLGTSEVAVRFDPETEENPIVEEHFRGVYSIPADTPTQKLYSRTLDFDRYATNLDDVNAFFPIDRMREALADGRFGSMPGRVYGAYNNYSKRKVLEEEGPTALEYCRADGVDAVIIVPI